MYFACVLKRKYQPKIFLEDQTIIKWLSLAKNTKFEVQNENINKLIVKLSSGNRNNLKTYRLYLKNNLKSLKILEENYTNTSNGDKV